MLRLLRKKSAYTLIELVIAAGVLLVIMIIMVYFYTQSSRLFHLTLTQSDLRQRAQSAVSFMSNELKNATRTSTETPSPNINIPSDPNDSIQFYLPADSDGDGTIVDSIGDTEWNTSNQIQYQYDSGQDLLGRLEGGNQLIIAYDVESIEFEDNDINSSLGIDEVRIILTITRTPGGPEQAPESITLTSNVKLRNQ